MSGLIDSYYSNSELSLAAYATLNTQLNNSPVAYVQALKNAGMSDTQARQFAGVNADDTLNGQGYTIVDQWNDPNGFSATVFMKGNEFFYAVRGTNDANDVLADIDLALGTGIASNQTLAMYNYFQRLITPSNSQALQVTYVFPTLDESGNVVSPGGLQTYSVNGLGFISDPGTIFTVSGHSLGGHLGMAFGRLFGSSVSQLYTYNAPGFNDASANSFFDQLNVAVGLGPNAYLDDSRSTNLYASNGFSLATGYATTYGIDVPVFIEEGVFAQNHNIARLTDSLALYDLFAKIDPALNTTDPVVGIGKITNLLKASSAQAASSLERVVDALVTFFGLEFTPFAVAQIDNREALYQRLVPLRTITANLSANNPGMVVDVLVNAAAADLANLAQGSTAFGYRYALMALNPFAILGNNDLYTPHNQNGELDLYDPVNRTGTLTTEWIADRAAFLAWKNQYFTTDGLTLYSARDENYLFENRDDAGKTDLSLTVVGNLAAGGNSGAAANPAKVVFGDTGVDMLTGGILSDRLYGEAGTDWLEGKANSDYLEGGKGLDIYNYNAFSGLFGISGNDGADAIRDTDGTGVLRYVFNDNGTLNSTVIADASARVSGLQWNSADGKFTYIRSQEDLLITMNTAGGGSLTIKDFKDGDFGIRLWEAHANPQITGITVIGDLQPQDFDPNIPGIQTQNDALGNVIVTANPEPDRDDVLNDSAGNDRIISGGGNDILRGIRGGDDWISGHAGRDNIAGGAGADLIESGADGVFCGESGGDIAYGDVGNDEIYGDTKIALADAITQGNTGAASNTKGDYLSGSGGDDWIVGATGDDYLDGGSGQDLIIGGAGSDNITGDYGYVATTPLWTIAREAVTANNTTTYTLSFVSGILSGLDNGLGGADVVYGGGGDDWIIAGVGDDFIDGGADSDKVWGEAGSDVLIGGAGNDLLVGDNPGFVVGSAEGGDYLDGGVGDDNLQGNGGNDVLIGGAGADTLTGGAGKDMYIFNKGDGTDIIFDTDANDSNNPDASVLVLGNGVTRGDIKFRVGSLAVDLGPSDPVAPGSLREVIHFQGFDQVNPHATTPVGEIRFADGISMSYTDILAQGFDIDGTEGNDNGQAGEPPMLVGTGVTDRIRGFGGNDVLGGLAGDDVLDGGAGADSILGGGGADIVNGGDGDDVIWGDADQFAPLDEGDDVLSGDEGNDQLVGGAGNDVMDGGADNDVLWGDGGNDTLIGGSGNDYLIGGTGDDVLAGGEGNDVYFYGLGDGIDHISDSSGVDWLVFQNGITLQGVRLGTGSLKLTLSDGSEVHLEDFDPDNPLAGAIEYIQFSDGVVTTREQLIQTLGFQVEGTFGDDALSGTAFGEPIHAYAGDDSVNARGGDDRVFGGDGNDIISGGADNDVLDGGSGIDILHGDAGADHLIGGLGDDVLAGDAGNDTLEGGEGSDIYLFGRGDGQDVAIDASGIDSVQLTDGLTESQITLRRVGSDLVIDVNGTADRFTAQGWFGPAGNFRTLNLGDGTVLDRADVEAHLVLNQAPLATEDGASAQEDVHTQASGNALANDIDPEGRALRITNPGTYSGAYGTLALAADGTYGYTLVNASAVVQHLAAGQTVTEHFAYIVTDDDPAGAATASSAITINVSGANDVPLVSLDVATVSEDGVLTTSGNVLVNDSDIDAGTTLRVTSPGTITSAYGNATLATDGAYSYTLNNAASAVQSLGRNQGVTERFHYTVSDGIIEIGAALEMNVSGVNDAPVLAAPLADQSVETNSAWSWQLPAGSFADIDYGDMLTYRATLADGAPLPYWLSFDGATQTFSGRVPRDGSGYLDINVIATDGTPGAASAGNLSMADVFRLSFTSTKGGGGAGGGGSQGNAGVGNGTDAPPPGQDYNFNDDAGTSPGNPGAQGGYGYQPQLPAVPDMASTVMRPNIPGHMPPHIAATVASVRPGAHRAVDNPVLPDAGGTPNVAASPGQSHAEEDIDSVQSLPQEHGPCATTAEQHFARIIDGWLGRTQNPAAPDLSWLDEIMRAEGITVKSGAEHQMNSVWQRMHRQLDVRLAGIANEASIDGLDPATLKTVYSDVLLAQFGAIGWGGVGVRDSGAADLRSFSGLKEGLARIA